MDCGCIKYVSRDFAYVYAAVWIMMNNSYRQTLPTGQHVFQIGDPSFFLSFEERTRMERMMVNGVDSTL